MTEQIEMPRCGYCLDCGRAFLTDEKALPQTEFGAPAADEIAFVLCLCGWPAKLFPDRSVRSLSSADIAGLDSAEKTTYMKLAQAALGPGGFLIWLASGVLHGDRAMLEPAVQKMS